MQIYNQVQGSHICKSLYDKEFIEFSAYRLILASIKFLKSFLKLNFKHISEKNNNKVLNFIKNGINS